MKSGQRNVGGEESPPWYVYYFRTTIFVCTLSEQQEFELRSVSFKTYIIIQTII